MVYVPFLLSGLPTGRISNSATAEPPTACTSLLLETSPEILAGNNPQAAGSGEANVEPNQPKSVMSCIIQHRAEVKELLRSTLNHDVDKFKEDTSGLSVVNVGHCSELVLMATHKKYTWVRSVRLRAD